MTAAIWVWRDILCEAMATRVGEISCAECYTQVDVFAELVLRDENAPNILPRVHHHLEHCHDCREEFQAFVLAVRATADLGPPRAAGPGP